MYYHTLTIPHLQYSTCSKTQGGADANGATHTQNADRGRAKQHDGTDPNTGQNRGQSTPGSGQEQPPRGTVDQYQI